MSRMRVWMLVGMAALLVGPAGAPAYRSSASGERVGPEIPKELKALDVLIGSWKGTAEPLNQFAKPTGKFWRETSKWEWKHSKERSALVWEVEGGKQIKGGLLTFDPKAKEFHLDAELADNKKVRFAGKLVKRKLELDAPVTDGSQLRLTLRLVNTKRFLYSLSERAEGKKRFRRTLQTGNTRKGVRFAAGSSVVVPCVVTFGQGTIRVDYMGTAYYVCCGGCRQAFLDDPEKYIAEYKVKLAAKKKEEDSN